MSDYFSVLHGCPQDSILGPKFFDLVIIKLLLCLEQSGCCCRVGSCFARALAYADDMISLSGSVVKIRHMLQILAMTLVL